MIITGSATGTIEKLNENHYCIVNNYNLEENCLTCTGKNYYYKNIYK